MERQGDSKLNVHWRIVLTSFAIALVIVFTILVGFKPHVSELQTKVSNPPQIEPQSTKQNRLWEFISPIMAWTLESHENYYITGNWDTLERIDRETGQMVSLTYHQNGKQESDMEGARELAFSGNTMWVVFLHKLLAVDLTALTYVEYSMDDGLPSDYISDVTVSDGRIWVATEEGIAVYNTDQNRWFPIEGSPQNVSLVKPDDGILWVMSGLFLDDFRVATYDTKTGQWSEIPVPENFGRNIITDAAITPSKIWAVESAGEGPIEGLWVLDRKTLAWTRYEGITANCVVTDSQEVWVGSYDGLYRIDLVSGGKTLFTDKDGLPNNNITALAIDKNYIWVGTENGLVRRKR